MVLDNLSYYIISKAHQSTIVADSFWMGKLPNGFSLIDRFLATVWTDYSVKKANFKAVAITKDHPNTDQIMLKVAYLKDGHALRFYYLAIGVRENLQVINQINEDFRDSGLELVTIDQNYRNDFGLNENDQGFAVFVQKHNEDDPDYTPGDEGKDIEEAFNTINNYLITASQRIQWDPSTEKILQLFYGEINANPETAQFQPRAFNGCDRVLKVFSSVNQPPGIYILITTFFHSIFG